MISTPPIDRIVRTIVAAMRPHRIVLFGSRARGDAHEDSDIDLMIEMDTALAKPYREMEIDKLFGLRDWSMDVFVYTPDEVQRLRHDVGTVVHVAEQEGEVLYERP
jgi:predicted nucleotidyltransferase